MSQGGPITRYAKDLWPLITTLLENNKYAKKMLKNINNDISLNDYTIIYMPQRSRRSGKCNKENTCKVPVRVHNALTLTWKDSKAVWRGSPNFDGYRIIKYSIDTKF